MGLIERNQKTYANIISDGSIRVKTDPSDTKGVVRKYELSDGTKGEKFERVYSELSGIITKINLFEGDYGKVLNIGVTDNDKENTLSTSCANNFGVDLMKKIPNIDLTKKVIFRPYSFEDDKKKLRKGVTVFQEGQKITSFFQDAENISINGFPVLDVEASKKYKTDDWKIYFLEVKKFLQNYIETNILPKFPEEDYYAEGSNTEIPAGETIKSVEDSMPPFKVSTVEPSPEIKTPEIAPEDPNAPTFLKTEKGLVEEINTLVITKLGATNIEEASAKIAEKLGLAYVEANYIQIIEKLKAMENIF